MKGAWERDRSLLGDLRLRAEGGNNLITRLGPARNRGVGSPYLMTTIFLLALAPRPSTRQQ